MLYSTNELKPNKTQTYRFPHLGLFLEEGRGREQHSYEVRINTQTAADSISHCSEGRAQLTQVVNHVLLNIFKNANQLLRRA